MKIKRNKYQTTIASIASGDAFWRQGSLYIKGGDGEKPAAATWCYCTNLKTGFVRPFPASVVVQAAKAKIVLED